MVSEKNLIIMTKLWRVGRHFWRLPSPPPAQADSATAGKSGLCLVGCCLSPRMETSWPPRSTCASVWPPSLYKKPKVLFFPVFQFALIASGPFAGQHWERLSSLPFYPHISCSCTWIRCLLQAEQAQLSQPLLTCQRAIRHWDISENGHLSLEYSRNFPCLRNMFDSPHFCRAVSAVRQRASFLSKPRCCCCLSVEKCHLGIQMDNLGPFLSKADG